MYIATREGGYTVLQYNLIESGPWVGDPVGTTFVEGSWPRWGMQDFPSYDAAINGMLDDMHAKGAHNFEEIPTPPTGRVWWSPETIGVLPPPAP
jgi:hypothetical protein